MLTFGLIIPATAPQSSEIPEGLMNYPIYYMYECFQASKVVYMRSSPFWNITQSKLVVQTFQDELLFPYSRVTLEEYHEWYTSPNFTMVINRKRLR
jgi:hypothetical protein